MTAVWLAGIVGLAAVATANVSAALFAWLAWPLVRRLVRDAPASVRARAIFAWRALPAALALGAGGIVAAAFVAYEPAGVSESAGVSLLVLAGAGAILVGGGMARAAGAIVASERLARVLAGSGQVVPVPGVDVPVRLVDSDFPVAAVIGLRRPGLVLARAVAERCSPGELAAIAAHERGHLAAGDNRRQLVLRTLVDALSWSRRGAEMMSAWHDAAEEAADDYASATGTDDVDLASALVTVSRLAAFDSPLRWASSVLFYRRAGIESRVRRLLGRSARVDLPPQVPFRPRRVAAVSAAVVAMAFAAAETGSGRALHAAAEWLVQHLP